MQSNWEFCVTPNKRRESPLFFADYFDMLKTLHYLFPKDLELLFSSSVTHTSVYSESERQVISGIGSIDD